MNNDKWSGNRRETADEAGAGVVSEPHAPWHSTTQRAAVILAPVLLLDDVRHAACVVSQPSSAAVHAHRRCLSNASPSPLLPSTSSQHVVLALFKHCSYAVALQIAIADVVWPSIALVPITKKKNPWFFNFFYKNNHFQIQST
jgi:hypothetical protein